MNMSSQTKSKKKTSKAKALNKKEHDSKAESEKSTPDLYIKNIEEQLETILAQTSIGEIWIRISIPNAVTKETMNLPKGQKIYEPNYKLPYAVTFGKAKIRLFNFTIAHLLKFNDFIKEHSEDLNKALIDERQKTYTSSF